MKKKFLFFALFVCCFCFPVLAVAFTNSTPTAYQNPEYEQNGHALTAIGADLAYTGTGGAYTGFSGSGVTVAIIDSGTMLDHEDLQNNISLLHEPILNLYAGEHGTHVAGIIGAEKNDIGMHGVAYNASLFPFSVLLGGGCDNPLFCMDWSVAYTILASDEYDSIKIVNNSWGTDKDSPITEDELRASAAVAKELMDKGKLIVAAAGNEMQMDPSSFPAKMAAYDSSTALNLISVVAYNPDIMPSEPDFIASYTNLAVGAQKWTLAAPGTLYSTIAYIDSSPRYESLDGTSMAAPVVSGAAALVSEAFPYMDGKQIADVLFSTAFKKEDLEAPNLTPGLSPYMIQNDGKGNIRFLFFTDNEEGMTFDAAKTAAGIVCEGTVECNEVTFEDVFGQGLLNVGDAVKGLKSLDAERLTAADYDGDLDQFFYPVDTKGYDSTWSNDIDEKRTSAHADAAVGLKKKGAGSLTLAGTNTFEGVSVVEKGTLSLTGSMTGGVTVDGGAFALNGGDLNGALTVNNAGGAQIQSGTLGGDITNRGVVNAVNGTAAGNIVNSGTFNVSGNFNTTGSFLNESLFNVKNAGTFHGNVHNASSGKVVVAQGSTLEATSALENDGTLSGFGTIDGTVNNNAGGVIATSLNVGVLNSSGNILLTADQTGDSIAVMHVNTLNISGGKVALSNDNVVYENGKTYTIINSEDPIAAFDNFEEQTYLSNFIIATTSRETNKVNTRIDYLRLSENALVSSFSPEEKQVVSIVDKIFIDQRQPNFGRFYYYSAEGLKKQVNLLRSKVKPIQNEQLPLTKVMASQVHAHLFANTMIRDAGTVRQPHVPMQQYRGKYYRGRSGGDGAKNQKVWGQFLGGVFKEDGDSSLNKDDITTKSVGAMFGYDYEFSEKFMIGLTTGVASAELKQDADKIEVKDYRAGFYTGSRFGRVTLNTLTMGGFQQYKSRRFMELGGMVTSNIAEFNGYSAEFDVNLGYDFARLPYRDHSFYLRSYIGASVNYIHQDAYKEKETSFLALGVDGVHDTSVSVSPGLMLGYVFSEAVISADIGYQRLLNGDSVQRSAYFLADTAKSTFSSLAADTDKDFFNAGVGFKTNLSRNWQAHFWAGTRLSKKTEALNLSATFSYTF